jgi:Flp pilus assembly pilin Flp
MAMHTLQNLLRDSRATTSIEYAVIAGLIALGITTSVNVVGDRIDYVMATLDATIGAPPGNSPHAP